MKSKLIRVGMLAFIVILAVMSGLVVGQFHRVFSLDSNMMARAQTFDPHTASAMSVPRSTNGMTETGTLDLSGDARVLTVQGKTKRLGVNSQTAVYVQGETLYRTPQGDAALDACAQERCPVYVVWSSQPELASAIVVALSPARQAQFPDPDPVGKTPIPFPSPTPPWIRIPSVVPATPLVERATPTR